MLLHAFSEVKTFVLSRFLSIAPSYLIFNAFGLFMLFFCRGHKIGVWGCWYLTLFFGFFQLVFLFASIYVSGATFGELFQRVDYGIWFELGQLTVRFTFFLDGTSLLMCQLVTIVSSVTQLYSFWYLSEDPNLLRFQSYLQLFTFFMLILVFAGNLILLFVGWEGVGLCSYLLISFWSTRVEARSAAIKAVALNRVGDCGFLCGLALLFSLTQRVDLSLLSNRLPLLQPVFLSVALPFFGSFQVKALEVIASMFLLAAAAKSAQLGFHGWLADAMEGPTPVSALIHAATMVTAGVYLVLRLQVLFSLAPVTAKCMALLGALSALFGALTAAFQWDIKKVIAYSTCRQLGYMFCSCGVQEYYTGFYHLVNHGYFKALLFLAAGVLIHNSNGEQDMRRMGNLGRRFPLAYSYFAVGSLSLIGLPGTAGFASKEKILDALALYGQQSPLLAFCQTLLVIALFFSAVYSLKIFYFVFKREHSCVVKKTHSTEIQEVPLWLLAAMFPLTMLRIGADRILHTFFMSGEHFFLRRSSAQQPMGDAIAFCIERAAESKRWLPLFTIGLAFAGFRGLWTAVRSPYYWRILFRSASARSASAVFFFNVLNFFQRGWYIDYSLSFVFALVFPKSVSWALFVEKGFGELLGPVFLSSVLTRVSNRFSELQTPRRAFRQSALMFLGLTLFIAVVVAQAPHTVLQALLEACILLEWLNQN